MKNYVTGACPVAFIAKNKQRIKQFNNEIVYLNNGDEFQVELFNPTKTKILARIDMDGKSIGPGIVLRPGERVFLERHVNDPRKFKFNTYEVNGANNEVKKAIEDNGSVVVKFFQEEIFRWSNSTISTGSHIYTTPSTTPWNPNYQYFNTCNLTNLCNLSSLGFSTPGMTGTLTKSTLTTNTSGNVNSDVTSASTLDFFDTELARNVNDDVQSKRGLRSLSKSTIETGRVEKGSASEQIFDPDSTKFLETCSWISKWTILPESRKQVTADDLVTYCSSCGRRKGAKERYCPSCGNKF